MRASNTTECGHRREKKCRAGVLPLLAALLLAGRAGAQEPFEAKVRAVQGIDLAVLEDGRRVRLQGISLPTPAVRPAGMAAELRAFLAKRLEGRRLWIFPEKNPERTDSADLLAVLRPTTAGASVNEEALAGGMAVLKLSPTSAEGERLMAANRSAQEAGRAWWAGAREPRPDAVPYLNGAVLGLHYEADLDYHRQLDELAAAGFRHVCLTFAAFLPDVRASRIRRHHPRTVRDQRLIETIAYARQLDMSVMLLPIVLLEEAGEDDWRGTIRPADEAEFWIEYGLFLARYLDIAEAGGVELFSIGSELSSMEDRTAAWQHLIVNARGRFRGMLTYSANWDHAHVPKFFPGLDLVGMSAYFELTEQQDPGVEELVAAWRRVGEELQPLASGFGKPVIFTELGYASQDGINRYPWNYVLNPDRLDLQEQERCFRAFIEVAPQMAWLRGAYFYDYFDPGGPADPGYSPRGKPAMEQWKKWAAVPDPAKRARDR